MEGRKAGYDKRTCQQNPPSSDIDVYKFTYTTLTFLSPDGTEFTFYDQTYYGQALQSTTCPFGNGTSRGTVFVTMDGSSATFISDTTIYDTVDILPGYIFLPSGYMILKDGTQYRISNGAVSWIRDRNGNKITFGVVDGIYTITDSLNRKVTIQYDQACGSFYGTCDIITFKGYGGTTRTIRVSKTTLQNALRSGFSLQTYQQLFPGLDGSSGSNYNPTVVSAVWLPNTVDQNTPRYTFKYNSRADLARIELPTGGAIEYDHTPASSSVIGYAPSIEIYRRVTERRVYKDGTTLESKTTYTVNQSERSDPFPWFTDVTVDQLSPASQLLARSKHYFNGSAKASLIKYAADKAYIYPAWYEGNEYKTEAFDFNGTTVLRRSEQTFQQKAAHPWGSENPNREPANDPRLTESKITLVDTNQVAKKTFSYDTYNNRTDVYEYNFGTGSAGSLVRRTQTSYLVTNPVNSTDYTTNSIHIKSLPTQISIYDASGNEKGRTTFEYDNHASDSTHAPLVNRVGISGFDSSFSTSYTTRGNVTKVTRLLLPSTNISAYSQYDIAGNVVKTIDAKGNQATLEYDDRFGLPNGEARANSSPTELSGVSQTSFAFVTKAVNALSHTAYTQFDYYLGKPVDGEDINGIVSSGYYNDTLDRPTQVIKSANNTSTKSQTTFAYDETNRTITTTSDFSSYNDNQLKSVVLYDGLGRTYETRSYETSTTYITTKQEFDDLGRVKKSYNPYRSGETQYYSTPVYDALGRVASVTTADNAAASTSYSGNTVTVTDQAGKVRRSVTDGLGRLTRVDEPDANGNHGSVSSPNQPTSYTYSVLDDLLTVTQGVQTRTFVYDSLKRLTSVTNPESGTVTFGYDDNGNLTSKTDARNITTTIAYDALNRPTSKTYSNDPKARLLFISITTTRHCRQARLRSIEVIQSAVLRQSLTGVHHQARKGHIAAMMLWGESTFRFKEPIL